MRLRHLRRPRSPAIPRRRAPVRALACLLRLRLRLDLRDSAADAVFPSLHRSVRNAGVRFDSGGVGEVMEVVHCVGRNWICSEGLELGVVSIPKDEFSDNPNEYIYLALALFQ